MSNQHSFSNGSKDLSDYDVIRPVTRRFPNQASLWESTNLPLAVVLTPLPAAASAHGIAQQAPPSLSSIPKCQFCGAPHATKQTHFQPKNLLGNQPFFICFLCAKKSPNSASTTSSNNSNSPQQPHYLFSLPLRPSVFSIPALSCPPLWFVILDGSFNGGNRNYCHATSQWLGSLQIPAYVHVSLLIASSHSISMFQLASPVPHLIQYNFLDQKQLLSSCLAESLTEGARSHLATASRALLDYIPSDENDQGMNVQQTVECILDALQTFGRPASGGNSGKQHSDDSLLLPYAGAKLTFLLSQQPSFGARHNSNSERRAVFDTTFGARDNPQDDLTATNLQTHYHSAVGSATTRDIVYSMDELGRRCAYASAGVDVLCLAPHDQAVDFALPLLGGLSHKSGAPGPVVVNELDAERLRREVLARVPWNENLVFGAELRVRLPVGFVVDSAAVEATPEPGPQLATLYVDNGLMGPASSVDDSNYLWRMGTCDPHTSFTVDLALKHRAVPTEVYIEEIGSVALKPVIQICFAYTAIKKDEASGVYNTVREMRIHSCAVPLAKDTETLYASLDPEVLSVVLFHKLALASFQGGNAETVSMAEDWLESTLISTYRSAENYVQYESERLKRGITDDSLGFYPNERLLDRDGDLTAEEVLLAQGHDQLQRIALDVYHLLQCEAFCKLKEGFEPSLDLRYAAISQMMSMKPRTLSRCIAPRLQLWASGENEVEPILENLDLSKTAIHLACREYGSSGEYDLIFFLETPYQVVALDGRYILPGAKDSTRDKVLALSNELRQAIGNAAASFRTKPAIIIELGGKDAPADQTMSFLDEFLVEDAPSATGHNNYREWRNDIALNVQE
jgi:hypothetical protein